MNFQDDTNSNSKSNKEKLQKTLFRQSSIEGEIPYLLKILNLTRRKPSNHSNDQPETRPENGFPEKNSQTKELNEMHYDCDTYREWKDGFHKILVYFYAGHF